MSEISARCFLFVGNISATICKNLIFKIFYLVRKVFLICAKSDNDYIVKPIALPVFYEKVKALIKRSKGLVRHNLLTVGNVSLNPNNGVVVSDGEEVTLTAKEYAILKILLENKNSVVSREKIITAVWHYDTMIDERVLDTHIKNIRKALGENASVLKTVIRRGYKAEDKK